MVRPQHDDGVFRPSGGVELIEKLPDLGVGVGGGRLVGADETFQEAESSSAAEASEGLPLRVHCV